MKRKRLHKFSHGKNARLAARIGNVNGYAEDGWKISPFEGLEEKLSVNVVKIDEWSRMADKIVEHPLRNWPKRYSAIASAFKVANTTNDLRYFVQSLVNTSAHLTEIKSTPDVLFLKGDCVEVENGWNGVFATMLSYLMEHRPENLRALEISGLMDWMVKKARNASLLEFVEEEVSVEFESLAELCSRMQWLLLMVGFNLDDVAIRFVRTDSQIAEIKTKLQEKKDAELRQKKMYEAKRKALLGRLENGSQVNQSGLWHRKQKRGMKPSSTGRHSPYLSQVRFDHGTYIVQNGVVVFLKRQEDTSNDEASERIMRSNVDEPEGWKGFGVARPESDGRFGGIITEDWVD